MARIGASGRRQADEGSGVDLTGLLFRPLWQVVETVHRRTKMGMRRRTLLGAGLGGLAWVSGRAPAHALSPPTRFIIHVSGRPGGPVDDSFAPLIGELQNRGFPATFVHSPVAGSPTPNRDRAESILKALDQVSDPVAIIGVSNEGCFLPLVAAARPVRRLVYVNALVPRPGQAFIEVCQTEQVAVPDSLLDRLLKASQEVTDEFMRIRHDPEASVEDLARMRERIDASPASRTIVGFYEICPLNSLPKVETVYVSGSVDDQIRPAWEQSVARRVLGVEPTVIPGAGHASIVSLYAAQLADACVAGLG